MTLVLFLFIVGSTPAAFAVSETVLASRSVPRSELLRREKYVESLGQNLNGYYYQNLMKVEAEAETGHAQATTKDKVVQSTPQKGKVSKPQTVAVAPTGAAQSHAAQTTNSVSSQRKGHQQPVASPKLPYPKGQIKVVYTGFAPGQHSMAPHHSVWPYGGGHAIVQTHRSERRGMNSVTSASNQAPEQTFTINLQTITGADPNTTDTRTTTYPVPDPNEYNLGGVVGHYDGEVHSPEGAFVTPKGGMPGASPCCWEWRNLPDGTQEMIFVPFDDHNHWRWLLPNRYHWSGSHRRRGTWTHISGPDWHYGNHNLGAHASEDAEEEEDEIVPVTAPVEDKGWSKKMGAVGGSESKFVKAEDEKIVKNEGKVRKALNNLPSTVMNSIKKQKIQTMEDMLRGGGKEKKTSNWAASVAEAQHPKAASGSSGSLNDQSAPTLSLYDQAKKAASQDFKEQDLIYGSMAQISDRMPPSTTSLASDESVKVSPN